MTGQIFVVAFLSQLHGDTLRWYDTDSTSWQIIGFTLGPYCHWAVRFLIDSSTAGRTIHSGRVRIWDPDLGDSTIIMRLCKGTASDPGVVLDSVIFPTTSPGFYEASFGDSIILNQGDNIWLWCYQYHNPGIYPGTVDGGPVVYRFGDWISVDADGSGGGTWTNISDYGCPFNWVMELILTSLDVEEGPTKPEGKLTLLPAPGGFYITGYEGPAEIYDPAGRLILSKEIKGKTLIGPLRPGVYFVVAVGQKGRIVIR